jgi:ornithine cyclodeaminase/alanine dehydrogenase-like protein (mu-crystallin family)
MPALYLTEDDVRELLDMPLAIDVVEEAFRRLADAQAVNVPRTRAAAPGIMLHSMSAAAEYLGYVGWKAYTTTRAGAVFHVGLYEAAGGAPAALIEADYLGQLRTGAASGVATESMARPDVATVGLFGAGKQAATQLKAVCTVRRIERVEVYSPSALRREAFAARMSEICGTQVLPVHAPEQAAAEKDVVICATTSKTPLFEGRILEPGVHLNVVGSNFLTKTEIDLETVRRADTIVCDSIEACRNEAGDFVEALEAGVTDWRLMYELADVVAGRQTGRAHPEQITLFKSVGLAIEDVALGVELLKRARAEGLGRALPF